MPQMKPMNWLYFYTLFSLYILLINIMNFFLKLNINKNSNMLKANKMKYINWKW